MFLQITCDDAADLAVPGQAYSFGVVKAAQARGDFDVLAERGRRLLRVHLPADLDVGLKTAWPRARTRLCHNHGQLSFRREGSDMQLGMIGLGRMGGNIVRRLMQAGHQLRRLRQERRRRCSGLAGEGAAPSRDLADFVRQLDEAARGLGDAAGGRDHRRHDRRAVAGCSSPATS